MAAPEQAKTAVDALPTTSPPPRKKGVARGFVNFIHDYGVAPLAVGVILANSVNDFVKALVDGIVTPLISLIFPGQSLQNFQVHIAQSTFKIGAVLSALLTFVIVALIVYIVAKVVLRNEELLKKK